MPPEYQAYFPAAICLYSSSSDANSLAEMGIDVIIDIISPVTKQYKGSYLTLWLSYHWGDDISLPFCYVSELLNDPSRAAEFLVTEKKFTDFALLCGKIAFGVLP